jgi:phosphate/sulfate permease
MTTTLTTPAPPTTHAKRSLAGGVLPLIGTILFVIVTTIQFANGAGEHWGPTLVANAVTYMIGWAGVGAGISHLFFGNKISRTIGFEKSPYELEVGFADLSFGIVALMAANYSIEFSLAVILVSSIYRVGCGIGHIRSMITERNFAINNTLILFTNFVVPALLIVAYYSWA